MLRNAKPEPKKKLFLGPGLYCQKKKFFGNLSMVPNTGPIFGKKNLLTFNTWPILLGICPRDKYQEIEYLSPFLHRIFNPGTKWKNIEEIHF